MKEMITQNTCLYLLKTLYYINNKDDNIANKSVDFIDCTSNKIKQSTHSGNQLY